MQSISRSRGQWSQLEKDTSVNTWAIMSMTTNSTMLLVDPVLPPAAILDMDSSATFSSGANAAATPSEIKDIRGTTYKA